MIDIISSSIRLGSMLRNHGELNSLFLFLQKIVNERDNPWSCDYLQLLSSYFGKFGLHSFAAVDHLLSQNIENGDETAKGIASQIMNYISAFHDYKEAISLSKKYGTILDEYIESLVTHINEYPQIRLDKPSIKIQQCSNELSTAILRSGALSWATDPQKSKMFDREASFIKQYEALISEDVAFFPYSKKTNSFIRSLNRKQKEVAYHLENIRFVQCLAKLGIIQGFLFELFEITEPHILKVKERHKDKGIHAIVLITDLFFPINHSFVFRCSYQGRIFYVLTKHMTMNIEPDKGLTTTLYGYCYPTSEYEVLKILAQ